MTQEEINEQQEEILDQVLEVEEAEAQPEVAYPNMPLNLDDFRAMVQTLESPNEPTRYSIDVSMIPEGMTPQEFITMWSNAGAVIPNGTRFVSGVDPVPVVEEVPHPIEKTEADLQAEHEAEQLKYEEQRKAQIKEREDRNKRLARARLRDTTEYHTHYHIKPDEMMFFFGYKEHVGMAKFDTEEGTLAQLNSGQTEPDERTGDSISLMSSSLLFDKDLNPVGIDYSMYDEEPHIQLPAIDTRGSALGGKYHWDAQKKWIIVDKAAFILSGNFKVKKRVGYTLQEVLQLKRKIVAQLDEAKEFITYLRGVVGEMYDEDNFEIIYNHRFLSSDSNNFEILLQFPNLEVKNSIEMTHNVDNMIVKLKGVHYRVQGGHKKNSMIINRQVDGLRTTFTPEDAYYGYSHSHLPSNSELFEDFCMGSEHFMTHTSSGDMTTELEFEMMLIAVFDHISWESLEGGPYIKMEDIGSNGNSPVRPDFPIAFSSHYGRHELRYLMDNFALMNIAELVDCFDLRLKGNGEVTYDLNKPKFITQLGRMTKDIMRELNAEEGTALYHYVFSEDKFYRGNDNDIPDNWEYLVKEAEKKVAMRPSVYMNGKHIHPKLIHTEAPVRPIVPKVASLHPTLVMYIAGIIKYHLLNELKNVKK